MRYLIIFISLVTGCSLQKPYDPPIPEIPSTWQNEGQFQVEAEPCFNWWEALEDPTLNELMTLASSQNFDLKIGALRVLKARTEANGKKGDLYPHVDGSFNCGRVSVDKSSVKDIFVGRGCLGKTNFSFFEIGFDASWEIDFFGRTAHEIAALKAGEEALEEDLSMTWVMLSAEIGKNYIELRSQQMRLNLLLNKIANQSYELSLKEELKSRGVTNNRVYAQTIVDSNTLQLELPLLEIAIDRNINRLSTLLGYNPGDLSEYLNCPGILPNIPSSPPIGMPSQLLQRRPDIRKAERELAKATELVGSAIASLFPRFSLWGFIGDINTKAGSLFNPSSLAAASGSQILLPIFNSKLIMQDITYNKLSTQEALYTYQKTVLESLEEAENAILAYLKGENRLEILQKTSKTLENNLEDEQELYSRGLNSLLNVIASEKQAHDAKVAYIQEQTEQILRYIVIYKALGGNWE